RERDRRCHHHARRQRPACVSARRSSSSRRDSDGWRRETLGGLSSRAFPLGDVAPIRECHVGDLLRLHVRADITAGAVEVVDQQVTPGDKPQSEVVALLDLKTREELASLAKENDDTWC